MICAVIFDMDGVLIDTEKHYNAAWCQAATEAGFPFTREHALLLRSCEAKEGEKLMQGIFGPSFDYYAIRERRRELVRERLAQYGLEKKPGVEETLRFLRAKGIKTAVISNKPDSTTVQVVREMMGELTPDIVRGGREGVPLKPDPTAVLEIIEQLGVEKADCLYVGDTATDMETGKNAGLFTVGVLWGFRDREEIEKAGAKAIVSKPAEILKLI